MTVEPIDADARFRAVFDQSSQFACILSVDGIVLDANKTCLEICGYARDQVIGRPFCETPWWRHDKTVRAKIRRATAQAAQGLPFREELSYVWVDGSEHMVDFSLYPIRNDRGEIVFLYPTGLDITDRKLVEKRIRRLTKNLESEVSARTNELENRNSDVLRQSALLRVLSHRLMEVQDSERRRISRELHDSAGQLLSVLTVNLAAITRQTKDIAPLISERADESHQIARQIMQEIRTMSYLLHPPLLEEGGLATALEVYVAGLNARGGLDVQLMISENFPRFPDDLELAVFRVAQECLTNIHRHSGSRIAVVRLKITGEEFTLEVRDQGSGISPEKLAEIQTHGSGVGIQGMRERLRPFNGHMSIDSDFSGTIVSATFVIPKSRAAGQP
ncbi:MAG TPA: PAS domain S-box protein [Candidatus Acidoferrales bacterium]|nr:PAS domain S-box protein [Candidatus Acidoferrales bacterium]